MLHIGVPPDRVTKSLLFKFKSRYRTRLCVHFSLLRNVIAEATGVDELKGTPLQFKARSKSEVIAACQAAAPWDVVKEPYDVLPFQAGEDSFGSEIFTNLVKLWGEKVYPSFKDNLPSLSTVPPIEELVLMCRMVFFFRFFMFSVT